MSEKSKECEKINQILIAPNFPIRTNNAEAQIFDA